MDSRVPAMPMFNSRTGMFETAVYLDTATLPKIVEAATFAECMRAAWAVWKGVPSAPPPPATASLPPPPPARPATVLAGAPLARRTR